MFLAVYNKTQNWSFVYEDLNLYYIIIYCILYFYTSQR